MLQQAKHATKVRKYKGVQQQMAWLPQQPDLKLGLHEETERPKPSEKQYESETETEGL